MAVQPRFLHVALPVPMRQVFDYLANDQPEFKELGLTELIGRRAKVQFGHRQMLGIIVSVSDKPSIDISKIKPIITLVDGAPCIPHELLALCRWAANYYHHPIGETLFAAVPQALRKAKPDSAKNRRYLWVHTTEGKGLPENALKRSTKQQAIHNYLLLHNTLPVDVAKEMGISSVAIRSLRDKGLIEKREITDDQLTSLSRPPPEPVAKKPPNSATLMAEPAKTLNQEQAAALEKIRYHQFGCYLLEGTTGAGKTELYMQAVARVLQAGKQALVLIPEIGLSQQTIARFTRRFAVPIAELHSGVSKTKHETAWRQAKDNIARIIIGTRLASLCAVSELGIIIIDEEHDLSYKQQDGLRYCARDLSIYRAHQLSIPILLGTATPSLESLYNGLQGKYEHLRITKRAGNAKLPTLTIEDIRGQQLQGGLCTNSLSEIAAALKQEKQALVFLNRRGYAPALMCHMCGWMAQCSACDTRMTLHASSRRLHCHYCDARTGVPQQCPSCYNTELKHQGLGTEQTEEALIQLFPGTPVIRIDKDSTRGKDGFHNALARSKTGKGCIMVGTQMLAKGHHLPDITLVIVADADQGLMSPDFRGPERMGQLIVQVAGRAGRGDMPGKVIIQSHYPNHPLLEQLLNKGYHTFARQLLNERREGALPPYRYMALLRAESKRADNAFNFLKQVKTELYKAAKPDTHTRYLGPLPASIEKVNHRFRYQLQIICTSRPKLHQLLRQTIANVQDQALAKRTRWSIDIDPLEN